MLAATLLASSVSAVPPAQLPNYHGCATPLANTFQ